MELNFSIKTLKKALEIEIKKGIAPKTKEVIDLEAGIRILKIKQNAEYDPY